MKHEKGGIGIDYRYGDIFSSNRTGHELIICHQVNCQGIIGAGLAKQICTMFPQVYEMYQRICTKAANCQDLLGKVLFCPIRYNGCEWLVANMFTQDGFVRDKYYTDYDALRKALTVVRTVATPLPARTQTTVRIPYKMGSGLAGGSWSIVEQIIKDELVAYDIPVEIWKRESV